jgi:hypothetical protein
MLDKKINRILSLKACYRKGIENGEDLHLHIREFCSTDCCMLFGVLEIYGFSLKKSGQHFPSLNLP